MGDPTSKRPSGGARQTAAKRARKRAELNRPRGYNRAQLARMATQLGPPPIDNSRELHSWCARAGALLIYEALFDPGLEPERRRREAMQALRWYRDLMADGSLAQELREFYVAVRADKPVASLDVDDTSPTSLSPTHGGDA